jgi:hypothetical protein
VLICHRSKKILDELSEQTLTFENISFRKTEKHTNPNLNVTIGQCIEASMPNSVRLFPQLVILVILSSHKISF